MNLRIMIVFVLLLNGCMGNQKNINNRINKEDITGEIKRDRTPTSPRINIPTHTF
jgi:hypothetical protein